MVGGHAVYAATVLLTGCDSKAVPPGPSQWVTEVASVSGVYAVRIGDSLRLSVRTNYPGAYTVTWESSNPSVATVSPSGVVLGVKEGPADIAARLSVAQLGASRRIDVIP
jgi:hypothetical protein